MPDRSAMSPRELEIFEALRACADLAWHPEGHGERPALSYEDRWEIVRFYRDIVAKYDL